MRKLLITIICVFISEESFAALPSSIKTYTTWGDFDVVYNTFLKISLLMSDARYRDVYMSVMVLSIVLGFAAILIRNFGSEAGLSGVLRLFGVIILGVIIYRTFILPTDSILIFDETLNLQGTVGGVPEGLILIAGLSNKIEKGFVDLIWTAAGPDTYKESPGGMVFSLMKNAFSGGVDLTSAVGPGAYIEVNIRNYVDDCLLRELSRPGTSVNINDFNNTGNFLNILSNAQSGSWDTVWYDDVNKAGISRSCTESWNDLNTFFTNNFNPASPLVDKFYKEKCGKAGLSTPLTAVGPSADQTCRTMLQKMIGKIINGPVTQSQVVTQYLIAHQLWQSFKDGDVKGVANYQTGTSMQGMAEMANDWIPIIRGMVFSVFVGLFPFIAILLVTPMFQKAASFILGAFVFLTAWGVCDALIHSFAMEKSLALMTDIGNGSLGIKSMLLFEDRSAKALAVFGAARWSAIMIAGVLSSIIAGFGGNAMAHLASQLSASKQTGAQTASTMGNPEQRAGKMSGLEGAVPSMTLSNQHGFNRMNQAEMYKKSEGLSTSLGMVDKYGGPTGSGQVAGDRVANTNVVNRAGSVAGAEETGMKGAETIAINNAQKNLSQATEELPKAKDIGKITGQQNKMNAEAMTKVLKNTPEEDIVNQQAQDKLTAVNTATKVREEYGDGDVAKASEIQSHANLIDTGKRVGSANEIDTPETAVSIGTKNGFMEKVDTKAFENLGNEFGWDSYQNMADMGKKQGYVSARANEYYGQALTGNIDPDLQKEVSYINKSSTGRQLWQQASRGMEYSNVSETEASVFNQLAEKAGLENVHVKPGDQVSVNWSANEDGSVGVSSIRDNKTAITDTGSITNINDDVMRYSHGRFNVQDPLFNKYYEEKLDSYIQKGVPEQEAHRLAMEEATTTMANFNAGKELRSLWSIGGLIGGGLNILDTFQGKNTIFSFSTPKGEPAKLSEDLENQNQVPLLLRNKNKNRGL
ncbi:MAG: conjugal transfer protein TraG N-terminal domain-containing protein [Proteobacteria bacterium]|nr:conjugal transfer protein TraG N-terminal domain-containing protein [Pseudomonadota bacterium]